MKNPSAASADLKNEKGSLKAWFLATRPQTLPISLGPILVGTFLAFYQVERMNWALALCTLISALFVQIEINLFNDALDYKKGEAKLEKLDLQRMIYLTPQQFFQGGCVCAVLALLTGIPLMLAGGWPLVAILLIAVALAYLYTGGPYPLCYTGTSNFFILLFYGWCLTGTAYYLQTGAWHWEAFLAGTQMGLLSIVPHSINNLRDYVADGYVGKKSTAVRFGPNFGRWEITLCSFIPYAIGFLWVGFGHPFMALLPLLVLPLAIGNIAGIWKEEPSRAFNKNLAKSALCQMLFGLLASTGIFLS